MIDLNSTYSIPSHFSWTVIDSSKLQDYITCPRRFFFRHVLGWERTIYNDLKFGEAWHKAMEVFLKKGTTHENVEEAFDEFMKCYREEFPPATDELFTPKIPENVRRALPQYVERFGEEDKKFTVKEDFVEIAGSVTMNEDRVMFFKMDAIVEDETGIFALEHKTTKSLGGRWSDQWYLKTQIGLYSHVLYCIENSDRVKGIIINGFGVHNPPKLKLDGTPYANAKDNEFLRLPVRKPLETMEVWFQSTNYWLGLLEEDFRRFSACSASDSTLQSFFLNTESCSKYRGCPFMDFCKTWQNPLRRCESPPETFTQTFWDPREKEESAGKIMRF